MNREALLSALVDALGEIGNLGALKNRSLLWLPWDIDGQPDRTRGGEVQKLLGRAHGRRRNETRLGGDLA